MNSEWRRLDNAAKIFPSAQKGSDTQMFRFSCELNEKVDREILQQATEEALEIFDVFRVVMKRGIFWYYLEKTDILPIVREEYKVPCAPVYHTGSEGLLFEVTYFNCRINLEVYHILSDGTGAVNFLNVIVAVYLRMKHNTSGILPKYDASEAQMEDDSFHKYYSKYKKHRERSKSAYRIGGAILPDDRMNVLIGHMSAKELIDAAHSCKATMTVFLAACLIEAVGQTMPNYAKKKDVIFGIPVNLRKFFPSETAANFFSLIFTGYNFRDGYKFEDIINKINDDFKEKLNAERLLENIGAYASLEHNLFAALVPLGIKDFCLRCAYKAGMRGSTGTLSNTGIIKMPAELNEYIKSYDVYTATNRLQVCVCSYLDTVSISFTTPFAGTDIERLFFRKLASFGIRCDLYSNRGYGGDKK